MISPEDYAAGRPAGSEFFLTSATLQAADAQQFHDAVEPYIEHGGGKDFVVVGLPKTESQSGQRLYAAVKCRRDE